MDTDSNFLTEMEERGEELPDTFKKALLGQLSSSSDWKEFLPLLAFNNRAAVLSQVAPWEYIGIAEGRIPHPGKRLVVAGDLTIEDDIPSPLTHLPEAFVIGNCVFRDLGELKSAAVSCSGSMNMSDCPSLEKIAGLAAGMVFLKGVGVTKLGADFCTLGLLTVAECTSLEVMNCSASMGVAVKNSGVTRTGPAFFSGGHTFFEGCPRLKELAGTSNGLVKVTLAGGHAGGEIDTSRLVAGDGVTIRFATSPDHGQPQIAGLPRPSRASSRSASHRPSPNNGSKASAETSLSFSSSPVLTGSDM